MTSEHALADGRTLSVAARWDAFQREPWIDRLLCGRGVVAFWLLYGIVHITLRVVMSGAVSLDDARASETVQGFAFGYELRQPPLYAWLLWSLQQVVGTGLASLLGLRYAFIALIGLATYVATLAVAQDRRWAALASLSLLFTYSVGWAFHEWATETLLLSLACLLTVRAAIGYLAAPNWSSALVLGLAVGLGLLSKFSYPLLLLALLIAIGSIAKVRSRLADPWLLASLAIALLMLSPYVFWLVRVHGDIVATASANLIQSNQGHLGRAIVGLARLAWSLPAFLMPWLAVVAVLTWPALVRRQSAPPAADVPVAERILLRTMVAAAALMAIGIAAVGATNIAERYMHPALMIAPVYVFARLARLVRDAKLRSLYEHRLVVAVLVTVLAIPLVRVFSFENEIFGKPTRPHAAPVAQLAKAIAERGYGTDGTFVTASVRLAGNLRLYLPNGRYLARGSFRALAPPRRASDDRACSLVWGDTEAELRNARALTDTDAPDVDRIEIRERSALGSSRRGVWFVKRLDPASPLCS